MMSMVKVSSAGMTFEGTPEEVVEIMRLMAQMTAEEDAKKKAPIAPMVAPPKRKLKTGVYETLKSTGEVVYVYETIFDGKVAKVARRHEGTDFYKVIEVADVI